MTIWCIERQNGDDGGIVRQINNKLPHKITPQSYFSVPGRRHNSNGRKNKQVSPSRWREDLPGGKLTKNSKNRQGKKTIPHYLTPVAGGWTKLFRKENILCSKHKDYIETYLPTYLPTARCVTSGQRLVPVKNYNAP
jgi:hypothetical protein